MCVCVCVCVCVLHYEYVSSHVQIIKGCASGSFEGGVSFGSFDCYFRDVCSRIERLIVNGYIKRNSTHQQILTYIPDPSEETTGPSSTSVTQNSQDEVHVHYSV